MAPTKTSRTRTLVVAAAASVAVLLSAASPTSAFASRPLRPTRGLSHGHGVAPSQTPTVPNFATTLNFADDRPDSDRYPEGASSSSMRDRRRSVLESRRHDWTQRSLKYYTTVSREQKRRNRGQLPPHASLDSPDDRARVEILARKHYFALRKIKSGQLGHAERIYRRIITELQAEASEEGGEHGKGGCDHANLAVSTLLLALLLQRRGDDKGARSAFLNFFRTAVIENDDPEKECACSAKVLQAYALFEMKKGNGRKSLEIVERAVRLDEELRPVLEWKQFRDVMEEVNNGRYYQRA